MYPYNSSSWLSFIWGIIFAPLRNIKNYVFRYVEFNNERMSETRNKIAGLYDLEETIGIILLIISFRRGVHRIFLFCSGGGRRSPPPRKKIQHILFLISTYPKIIRPKYLVYIKMNLFCLMYPLVFWKELFEDGEHRFYLVISIHVIMKVIIFQEKGTMPWLSWPDMSSREKKLQSRYRRDYSPILQEEGGGGGGVYVSKQEEVPWYPLETVPWTPVKNWWSVPWRLKENDHWFYTGI